MDEEDYFEDPIAYVVAFASLVGMFLVIICCLITYRRLNILRQAEDRQGNVFAIHDETSRERRYDDIFFIEPNSVEAARIRAQLEKDEKDLPSYDEVMRMANLNSPTAAPAASAFDTVAAAPGGAVSINASSSSVNTTETTLTVPPYVEVDMSATSNSTRSVTPPPYSPPTAALPAIIPAAVVLPIAASAQTQQTSSNV